MLPLLISCVFMLFIALKDKWVTVCCYCEITTVNTLSSVFILVDMYRLLLYTIVRVGRIYKCFSFAIVAAKGRDSEVRQSYSCAETDSLKQRSESELCTVSAGCAEQAARWTAWDSSVVPSSVCW
jgi:hypothetical protein